MALRSLRWHLGGDHDSKGQLLMKVPHGKLAWQQHPWNPYEDPRLGNVATLFFCTWDKILTNFMFATSNNPLINREVYSGQSIDLKISSSVSEFFFLLRTRPLYMLTQHLCLMHKTCSRTSQSKLRQCWGWDLRRPTPTWRATDNWQPLGQEWSIFSSDVSPKKLPMLQ